MELFDLHCDTITECCKNDLELKSNDLHISLDKAAYLSSWCQLFAIWMPNEYRKQAAFDYFDNVYDYFIKQDAVRFCKNGEDIKNAVNENKTAAILTVEGGAATAGQLERLDYMYSLGVRLMTLTWNGECELGFGSDVKGGTGLTEFGFKAIRKMEELGMIIDVSHLNEKGFCDVAENTSKPFVASHSNSKTVWNHHRNLTDEQFKIISDWGGLVGLNFYTAFLPENSKNGSEGVLRNVYHFLELGGENTISIGADFDGAQMHDDLNGIDKIGTLFEYLISNGIPETTVKGLFFGNAYRFFTKVL